MKLPIFLAAVLFAVPACAAEIDFSKHILDLDGHDIPSSTAKDAKPFDLAMVAETALLAPADRSGGSQEAATVKLQKFALALRIHDRSIVTLTSEEVTILKDAIAATYPGSLVVGRAVELLDPSSLPKEK